MKTALFAALLVLAASAPSLAHAQADDQASAYHPDASAHRRHRWLGVQLDVGVPDGAALGLVVRPRVEWLRLELAGTYNGLAPGMRLGATLDPVSFGIAPTLTAEAGFAMQGTVPDRSDLPSLGYDYLNLHLGVEFGKRDYWRFFVHAGPSFVHASTENFSSITSGAHDLQLGEPTADAWLLPTAKLGFALYF